MRYSEAVDVEQAVSTTVREFLPEEKEKKVLEESEVIPTKPPALDLDKESVAGPPKMTTALETGPVSQVDSAIPVANGIAKEANEVG
ncbi:unnamed protein product [Strongylus vulgaris]|uniref:Uncharacterized protein n=1 Tax=Strongylus vulgaris TaxID=40348 RepID=A0A3P7IW98_STRVU|nr:unnamed protein product [Strongylus vulgaris]